MQLSLRAQLIAGVATVGAAAMVVTPIAQPDLMPSMQRVSSAVQLTAFDNPVTVLLATLADTSASIFDTAPLLDPAELFWPDSFYATDFSYLYAPGFYGLVPDFAYQVSFGALSALVGNPSGYIYAATEGLTALVGGPIAAVTNVPFALITAAGYLAAGQPELAIAELQAQILGPLQQGITAAVAAASYIITNVITNATTLVSNTIPGLLTNLTDTVVNGGTYVVQSAIATLSTAVAALAAGQFETAWNTAVNGLLGPGGTLGQLKDLTIGIGIVELLDYGPPDGEVLTVTIPSLRSDVTSAGQRLGDLSSLGDGGIRNDPFQPLVTAPAPAVALPVASRTGRKVAHSGAGEAAVANRDTLAAADVAAASPGGLPIRPGRWAIIAWLMINSPTALISRSFAARNTPVATACAKAYSTMRRQPARVLMPVAMPTACGSSSICTKCSWPMYRPSRFSRTTTMSILSNRPPGTMVSGMRSCPPDFPVKAVTRGPGPSLPEALPSTRTEIERSSPRSFARPPVAAMLPAVSEASEVVSIPPARPRVVWSLMRCSRTARSPSSVWLTQAAAATWPRRSSPAIVQPPVTWALTRKECVSRR